MTWTEFFQIVFTNRQIASIIWLFLLSVVLFSFPSIRKSLFPIIKHLFEPKILILLLLFGVYFAILIFILDKFYFFYTVDFLFWFFTVGIVLFFEANKIEDTSYFKGIFIDSFKLVVFLEFIINFYSFSLWLELLLVPMITFIILVKTVLEVKNVSSLLNSVMGRILTLFSLLLIIYSGYRTYLSYQDFFSPSTLNFLLFPIILTIGYFPFLYLLALFMKYESFFVRLDIFWIDQSLAKRVKKEIVLVANLNLNKLNRIQNNLRQLDLENSSDSKEYITRIGKKPATNST